MLCALGRPVLNLEVTGYSPSLLQHPQIQLDVWYSSSHARRPIAVHPPKLNFSPSASVSATVTISLLPVWPWCPHMVSSEDLRMDSVFYIYYCGMFQTPARVGRLACALNLGQTAHIPKERQPVLEHIMCDSELCSLSVGLSLTVIPVSWLYWVTYQLGVFWKFFGNSMHLVRVTPPSAPSALTALF